MPTAISMRFLTGRAHLHPWDTHHSEGRVDWPPAPWRLLRALVAVAGRGLTTLPGWYDTPLEQQVPEVPFAGESLSKRGVPAEVRGKLSLSKARGRLTLKEPLSDDEAAAWNRANSSPEFAAALDELRRIIALPDRVARVDVAGDGISLSRLACVLTALVSPPEIWLPRTSVGHTRHFFTIHDSGVTKTTGSAVFDTFAVVDKAQASLFVWPSLDLSSEQETDLRLLLARLGYFGRAESWCSAKLCDGIWADVVEGRTHWRCICWDDASAEGRRSLGREHRDFTLERRLASLSVEENGASSPTLPLEARRLLRALAERRRPRLSEDELQRSTSAMAREPAGFLLLRCLLRESGEDMKDGLERPVGTRWVHYAVPREIYNLPPRAPRRATPVREEVHVVRYVLNTATTQRPVLPRLTDALLVGEQFRRALMARHQAPSENFSGKSASGQRLEGHQHTFFLPEDEDLDGFIDHVTVWCPRAFTASELRVLRSLAQLPQRRGRPRLLATPTRVAAMTDCCDLPLFQQAMRFQSITPYVPARHAFRESGRLRENELPDQQLARDVVRWLQAVGRSNATIVSMTFLGEIMDTPSGHQVYRNGIIRLGEHLQPLRCLHFVQHRRMKERRTGKLDHGQFGGSWVIDLSEPVRGPIALGYGCHFGLGQFRPGRDEG